VGYSEILSNDFAFLNILYIARSRGSILTVATPLRIVKKSQDKLV
jgi:hypothetical protein